MKSTKDIYIFHLIDLNSLSGSCEFELCVVAGNFGLWFDVAHDSTFTILK